MNFCIGPMSKNTVDAVVAYSNNENREIGLIPSRRQIEFSQGYVNNWSTKTFAEYIRTFHNNYSIFLQRDHAGPGQGLNPIDNDVLKSLDEDCMYLDAIHIDPWKQWKTIQEGAKLTAMYIQHCLQYFRYMLFEVGTEQAIFPMTTLQLKEFLSILRNLLGEMFDQIEYVVVQGGTEIKSGKNIGISNENRLREMIDVVKSFGKLSKEHNGDWLRNDEIQRKFQLGLDCLNIAPEFGGIESQVLIDHFNTEEFNTFFKLCANSNFWKKWFPEGFDANKDKRAVIKAAGHYVFSNPIIKQLKDKHDLDNVIQQQLYSRLKELHVCV